MFLSQSIFHPKLFQSLWGLCSHVSKHHEVSLHGAAEALRGSFHGAGASVPCSGSPAQPQAAQTSHLLPPCISASALSLAG